MLALLFALALASAPSTPPVCPAPAPAFDGLVNIYGHVTNATGDKIPFAKIRLKSAVDSPAQYAKTGLDGYFHILAKPGTYTLITYHPALLLASKDVVVQAGHEYYYDIALQESSLMKGLPPPGAPPYLSTVCFVYEKVPVNPIGNGLPIDSVDFTLESTTTPKRVFTGSKPADYADDHPDHWGCWSIDSMPDGNYTLRASAAHYHPLQQNLTLQRDLSTHSQTRIVELIPIPPTPPACPVPVPAPNGLATIHGQVLDDLTGDIVSDALVRLKPTDDSRAWRMSPHIMQKRTSEAAFRFSAEPGIYNLMTDAPDFFLGQENALLQAGRESNHNIRLRTRACFPGQCIKALEPMEIESPPLLDLIPLPAQP